MATDLDAGAIQRETRQAIATFAEFEDQRGLAKAWGLLAALGFLRCRIAEAEAAAGQAVTHARLARDDPSESWAWGLLAQGAFWGPTPAPEGIRRCQELLAQANGNRRSELIALQSMAGLQAMDAQAEAATASVGQALALAGDMGENRVAALAREFAAIALALSGDPGGAEQQLRQGIRVLERQGESGMRSNLIADLALSPSPAGPPRPSRRMATGPSPPATCSRRSAGAAPPPAPCRRARLAEARRLPPRSISPILPTSSHAADALSTMRRGGGRRPPRVRPRSAPPPRLPGHGNPPWPRAEAPSSCGSGEVFAGFGCVSLAARRWGWCGCMCSQPDRASRRAWLLVYAPRLGGQVRLKRSLAVVWPNGGWSCWTRRGEGC